MFTFSRPDARSSHVHTDLVGPCPLSLDQCYLLMCIDRFIRWPESIPLPGIIFKPVVNNSFLHWVASGGVLRYITIDRGQ